MAEEKVSIVVTLKNQASAGLKKIGIGFDTLRAKTNRLADRVGKAKFVFAGIAAAFGVIGKTALKTSGQFEKWNVAFTVMLKSADKAKVLLGDIEKFSAATPFQLPTLVEGAKNLLAFGVAQEDVVTQIERLGNAAQGEEEILKRLIPAFGKVKAIGKASFREIRQFAEAGVPIIQALADTMGVTREEILEMSAQGKISFDIFDEAIKNLTTGTGQFAGLIALQAKTLPGLISTMGDNFNLLAKDIGDILLPVFKKLAEFMINITQKFRNASPTTKKFVVIMGAAIAAFSALVAGAGLFIAIAPAMAAAWTLATGPIGIAVAAIGALILGTQKLISIIKGDVNKQLDTVQGKIDKLKEQKKLFEDDE